MEEPIKIGFVSGQTGKVADLGIGGRNGAMLAVEEINAKGGIKGRRVELIVQDDRQNPETAKKAVSELIAMEVECIIGPMTSSIAMATVPLVNASGIVMVSPTVTTTMLAGKDDNFLRVISTTSEYAAKSARYHFQKHGYGKVAAIYDIDNSSYSESWLHDFRTAFENLGGKMVKTMPFRSGDNKFFLPLARELLAAKPDMVLIIANAIDAALICQQIRKVDRKIPVAMSEWASTEKFVELAGSASEGVYMSQFLNHADQSQRYLSFLKAYKERFGQEPGFAGIAGYDAAMAVLKGVAGRKSGQSLKNALLSQEFNGVQQTIKFDPYGEANRNTFITIIRNGQYVTLE
jgi:branched-chain amino acid transport system substrate-binding protein